MSHEPHTPVPAGPPAWDPSDKRASVLAWAEWLHAEARRVFTQDGTHAQMLFLFDASGAAFINPVPPGTTTKQVTAGISQAFREHGLYAVITVAEVWMYYPRGPKDHTVFQLMDGETTVAALGPDDKREALMVRVQSDDGLLQTWLAPILRADGRACLGASQRH